MQNYGKNCKIFQERAKLLRKRRKFQKNVLNYADFRFPQRPMDLRNLQSPNSGPRNSYFALPISSFRPPISDLGAPISAPGPQPSDLNLPITEFLQKH